MKFHINITKIIDIEVRSSKITSVFLFENCVLR